MNTRDAFRGEKSHVSNCMILLGLFYHIMKKMMYLQDGKVLLVDETFNPRNHAFEKR